MTLVYDVDPGNAPGAHALVVGVGRYPWLVGGDAAPRGREITEGMGQLASPPVSARAIVDWLLGSYWHPDRRLTSIDLLLSDPGNMTYVDAAETVHQVEEASRVFARPDPSKVREFADDIRDGKFVLPISGRMPLREAGAAHELVEKGGGGKIVLTI